MLRRARKLVGNCGLGFLLINVMIMFVRLQVTRSLIHSLRDVTQERNIRLNFSIH